MGKRTYFKSPEQRLKELIQVRMKLGTYSHEDYGYIQLLETKSGDFTFTEHRRGRLITNPRKMVAELIIEKAEWCEKNKFRFFPKYKPEQFGNIVNPKTGKLYKEFSFADWSEGDTENIAPTNVIGEVEKEEEHSEILSDLFGNWK